MPKLIDRLLEGDFSAFGPSAGGILDRATALADRADKAKRAGDRDQVDYLARQMSAELSRVYKRKESLAPLIAKAVPVVADDVAAFIYAQDVPVTFRNWDMAKDFPILSPPFPVCFVEWSRPDSVIRSADLDEEDQQLVMDCVLSRAGVLFVGGDIEHAADCPLSALVRGRKDYAHWLAFAAFGVLRSDGGISEKGQWAGLVVDEMGKVIGEPIIPDERALFRSIVAVGLLAVTFMHCKGGVRLVEVPPNAALNEVRRRRNKPPRVGHRTLVIEGLAELLRRAQADDRERGGDGTLKRALHLVRGHFASYSDRPLFGHYRGTVFRAAHMRGHKKLGQVTKDYEVKGPSNRESNNLG